MSSPVPGWYDDPWGQAPLRWWDGNTWTGHTSDGSHLRAAAGRPINQQSRADRLAAERRIAPWLRGVLFLWPLATALSLGGFATAIDQLQDTASGDPAFPTYFWVAQLGGLVGIAVSVLRIIWLYRAASLARDLGFDARREPLHAAIGWLIPIINYWWPYQGLTDCFPADQRPDRRIAWWWGMSIASGFSLILVIAVPFVAAWVAVALVVVALTPAVVAAALEVGLIGEVLAVHERLAS